MEKVPSNPMSDYDFAEEPDEIVEQGDIMHVNKSFPPRNSQFHSQ